MKLSHTVALKEWASAVEALRSGEQCVLMRKGGIVEETRDFAIKSHSFYLFPTYEHQKRELVKDRYRDLLDRTVREADGERTSVTVRCFAELVEDIEVTSRERLDRIRDFHIWTDGFAEERLRWKKTKPLHVLLLRVYELERPWKIPVIPKYAGCRSWIEMEDGPPEHAEARPVLDDGEFSRRAAQIRNLLLEKTF